MAAGEIPVPGTLPTAIGARGARHNNPGHFSFNTRQGQCPTCRGLGHIDLDVQYLPDITVGCPTCHGARFNDATLAVRIDGLTVADVLGLSVHDALERFSDRGPVAAALQPVDEVGLGYLGQVRGHRQIMMIPGSLTPRALG
jgi:excinuclease ABC subunit A